MDEEVLDIYKNLGMEVGDDFQDQSDFTPSDDVENEPNWGNAIVMGMAWTRIFIKGFVWFPFDRSVWDDPLEKMLTIVLIAFRVFLYGLLGLALYIYIKNRGSNL